MLALMTSTNGFFIPCKVWRQRKDMIVYVKGEGEWTLDISIKLIIFSEFYSDCPSKKRMAVDWEPPLHQNNLDPRPACIYLHLHKHQRLWAQQLRSTQWVSDSLELYLMAVVCTQPLIFLQLKQLRLPKNSRSYNSKKLDSPFDFRRLLPQILCCMDQNLAHVSEKGFSSCLMTSYMHPFNSIL